MAGLTASVDTTKTPLELTVTRPPVHGEVTVLGETISFEGVLAIKVTDAERTWTLKTDNGTTALYTATA